MHISQHFGVTYPRVVVIHDTQQDFHSIRVQELISVVDHAAKEVQQPTSHCIAFLDVQLANKILSHHVYNVRHFLVITLQPVAVPAVLTEGDQSTNAVFGVSDESSVTATPFGLAFLIVPHIYSQHQVGCLYEFAVEAAAGLYVATLQKAHHWFYHSHLHY